MSSIKDQLSSTNPFLTAQSPEPPDGGALRAVQQGDAVQEQSRQRTAPAWVGLAAALIVPLLIATAVSVFVMFRPQDTPIATPANTPDAPTDVPPTSEEPPALELAVNGIKVTFSDPPLEPGATQAYFFDATPTQLLARQHPTPRKSEVVYVHTDGTKYFARWNYITSKTTSLDALLATKPSEVGRGTPGALPHPALYVRPDGWKHLADNGFLLTSHVTDGKPGPSTRRVLDGALEALQFPSTPARTRYDVLRALVRMGAHARPQDDGNILITVSPNQRISTVVSPADLPLSGSRLHDTERAWLDIKFMLTPNTGQTTNDQAQRAVIALNGTPNSIINTFEAMRASSSVSCREEFGWTVCPVG